MAPIASLYFKPRSFLILFTNPVPSSFRLPCIGRTDILSPSRTIRCPPWPDSKVAPCFWSQRLNSWLVTNLRIQQICCVCQQKCCVLRFWKASADSSDEAGLIWWDNLITISFCAHDTSPVFSHSDMSQCSRRSCVGSSQRTFRISSNVQAATLR